MVESDPPGAFSADQGGVSCDGLGQCIAREHCVFGGAIGSALRSPLIVVGGNTSSPPTTSSETSHLGTCSPCRRNRVWGEVHIRVVGMDAEADIAVLAHEDPLTPNHQLEMAGPGSWFP